MDTSKDYYEAVMRDYSMYGRGRTLEQYCRDEGADYKWIDKAAELYGATEKGKPSKTVRKVKAKTPDMIRLHFEPETSDSLSGESSDIKAESSSPASEIPVEKNSWQVASLRLITPEGHEIDIKTSTPSAVTELLAKITV